jgi:hypothetical protein
MFMSGVCHQACFVARATYLASGGFETTHRAGADPRLLMRMLVRDRLQHRHVGRVVVRYKGGGDSTQRDNVRDSRLWCNEQKRKLYSRCEYAVLTGIERLRAAGKSALYDTLLWRVWRGARRRAQRQEERISG